MGMWLPELRERLLRGGVAPRYVRRYLIELREHLADLTAEEERAGRAPAEATAHALTRLGPVDELARTMIDRPELRSWTAKAPWTVLGVGPLLSVAAGWSIALLILVLGWTLFVPDSPTPFVPVHGFAIFYFGVGRGLYFSAPVLSGWWMVVLAQRQKVHSCWPVVLGSLLVALLGATGGVEIHPSAFPGDNNRAGIQSWPPASQLPQAAGHALLMFSLITLPYLVWRWRDSSTSQSSI